MKKIIEVSFNANEKDQCLDAFYLNEIGIYKSSSDKWQNSTEIDVGIIEDANLNKIDFNNLSGKLIYRTPKLSLPREKLNIVHDKYNTKSTRDMKKADCIITSVTYINSLVSTTWDSLVTGEDFIALLTGMYKGKNGFKNTTLENDFISKLVVSNYYIIKSTSTYYWNTQNTKAQKFLQKLEDITSSRGYHSYVIPGHIEIWDYLNAESDNLIMDTYVNDIATEDSLTIDAKVYDQLNAMFKSSDQENIMLGMEIISNCNVEDSKGFIALLFFQYEQTFRAGKSWSHVNFKTIRSKFEKYALTYARHSVHPYNSFITKLIEDKGLTKYVMNSVLDSLYQTVIESSFGMDADSVFEFKRTDLKLKPEYKKKCIDKNLGQVINEEHLALDTLPF